VTYYETRKAIEDRAEQERAARRIRWLERVGQVLDKGASLPMPRKKAPKTPPDEPDTPEPRSAFAWG
jgi:hypothetical protein